MNTVPRVYRATWIKLRRPTLLWGTYAAAAALIGLFSSLLFVNAGNPNADGPGDEISLADLAGAGGLLTGLEVSAALLGVIALSVAATAFAGEYSTGTLRNLLIRAPRRVPLLAGAWSAVAVFAVGAAVVATAAAAATGLVLADGQGVSTAAWFTADGWQAMAETFGRVSLSTIGYATLGAALGVVLRSSVSAVTIGVAWILVIEQILAATVSGSDRWLPGQLLATVATGGTDTVTFGAALVTAAAYLAGAALLAGTSFARRDVTA
jgi:ABC-2 type transport system permease protein